MRGFAKCRTKNRASTKSSSQRLALIIWMAGKNEIGRGRQDLEAKSRQPLDQSLTVLDDARPAALKVSLIFDGGDGSHLSETAERVGVEAVFNPAKPLDEGGIAYGITDTQARKRPRLRHRVHHEQVRVDRQQWNRGFCPEIDIGFVDHHRLIMMLVQQRGDLRPR